MDSSGVIHGPPARAKPSLACMAMRSPSRSASLRAWSTASHHSEVSCSTGGSHCGGSVAPRMGIRYAPPSPASRMASRSAVIPSWDTAAFIQYQKTQGRADSGG
jgi:hypothetical protein